MLIKISGINHHFLYYLNMFIRAALIGFQFVALQCVHLPLRTTILPTINYEVTIKKQILNINLTITKDRVFYIFNVCSLIFNKLHTRNFYTMA